MIFDLNVFENASEEAEWAISGAFEFSNDLNENLTGKRKQSFANGFLGLDTFGRSTLVSIVSIDESKKNLRETLEICPTHGDANLLLSTMQKYVSSTDQHITLTQEAILSGEIENEEKAKIHFALGKALGDVGIQITLLKIIRVGI